MTRNVVLVGKIGPAFNGGEIRAHGSVTYGMSQYSRITREYALSMMVDVIADNMAQYDAYRFDVATNDGVFR